MEQSDLLKRLEPSTRRELESLPPGSWKLTMGRRHIKVFVGPDLVGVSSKTAEGGSINNRSVLNLRTAIRRAYSMHISPTRVAPATRGMRHGSKAGQKKARQG